MKTMTKAVNVYEAKTHFSKLLAAVAKGQRITICKDGTPVAQLGPLESPIPVRRPGLLKGRVTIATRHRRFVRAWGVNLLLDTHVYLWFVVQSSRLSNVVYH